jgi:hypothetical protein
MSEANSFYSFCHCPTFFGGDNTKHNPSCPNDGRCRYCGQKPWLCEMLRTCCGNFLKQKDKQPIEEMRGVMSTIPFQLRHIEARTNNLKSPTNKLSPSTSLGIFKIYQQSSRLQFKQPTAEVVSQMETLLWRMRRLYLNEKKRREEQKQLRAAENRAKKASEKGNAAKKVEKATKAANQAKGKSVAASVAASASLLEN